MIQLFYGENDYARTRSYERARDEFIAEHGQHAVTILEGSDVSTADLPQLLQGQSLFADSKLTIIRDASANKQLWEDLGDNLEKFGDVDLLLIEFKPDKRTRTFKWLQKHADVQECKLLDERATISWLQTEARRQGIDLNHELAQYMVERSGTDQWRLHNDLAKLAMSQQPLSRQLITDLIEPHPSASVFDLLDATLSGRRDDAVQALAIVKMVEDPYKFMGLLSSQLYALALCVSADHRPAAIIAKDAGIHPFVAQKTLALARMIDQRRLAHMIEVMTKCDHQLKSTGSNPWTVIESAIGSL